MLLLFWRGITPVSGQSDGYATTDSTPLYRRFVFRNVGSSDGRALVESELERVRAFAEATGYGQAFTSSVVSVTRELVGESSGSSGTTALRNLARPRIVRISIRADQTADVRLETLEVLH